MLDDIIDDAALEHEIDPDLIHAVIATESGFNPLAQSPVGAQGLMQLMPALQAALEVEDPFNPRENIMAGARYLKRLMNKHHDNVDLALASYNAGPRTPSGACAARIAAVEASAAAVNARQDQRAADIRG